MMSLYDSMYPRSNSRSRVVLDCHVNVVIGTGNVDDILAIPWITLARGWERTCAGAGCRNSCKMWTETQFNHPLKIGKGGVIDSELILRYASYPASSA
jgi:hypothetical protein